MGGLAAVAERNVLRAAKVLHARSSRPAHTHKRVHAHRHTRARAHPLCPAASSQGPSLVLPHRPQNWTPSHAAASALGLLTPRTRAPRLGPHSWSLDASFAARDRCMRCSMAHAGSMCRWRRRCGGPKPDKNRIASRRPFCRNVGVSVLSRGRRRGRVRSGTRLPELARVLLGSAVPI
jgi:hypothetical protein